MIIVYTPQGGEPEHYDATSLKVSEASIVQRTIDMKWQDILKGLEVDDLDAMRGIVWVFKKRSQPSLRFGEFDPGVGEMTTRMDLAETAAYIDNFVATAATEPDLTLDAVREILLSRLPDVSIDPDRARDLVTEKTKDPKEDSAPADTSPEQEPAETSPSQSPTSSEPETDTSASSPTSSTSLPLVQAVSTN